MYPIMPGRKMFRLMWPMIWKTVLIGLAGAFAFMQLPYLMREFGILGFIFGFFGIMGVMLVVILRMVFKHNKKVRAEFEAEFKKQVRRAMEDEDTPHSAI